MRVHFGVPPPGLARADLGRGFSWVAEAFDVLVVARSGTRVRTLIVVSWLGHCLNGLLFRWKTGALPVNMAGVVSNRRDLENWPSPTASRFTTCGHTGH